MKQVKIRNLPPVRLQIPANDFDKPEVLQLFEHAQRCGFTAIRFPAEMGYCRVNLTVVGPKPEQTDDNLALLGSQAEVAFQQLLDEVKALTEQPR